MNSYALDRNYSDQIPAGNTRLETKDLLLLQNSRLQPTHFFKDSCSYVHTRQCLNCEFVFVNR